VGRRSGEHYQPHEIHRNSLKLGIVSLCLLLFPADHHRGSVECGATAHNRLLGDLLLRERVRPASSAGAAGVEVGKVLLLLIDSTVDRR